jgi:protein gp37
MTMARRLKAMGSAKYQNDGDPRTSGPGFAVTMHQESVLEPILKWPRKSQVVFLDSMSDVFMPGWAPFFTVNSLPRWH